MCRVEFNKPHAMTQEPAPNRFRQLHQACLAEATRPFRARGSSVVRCPACLLAQNHCICAQRTVGQAELDVILLLHRDEVFKPTNTGRLIADVLPANTYAFAWSRTEPCAALLGLLNAPERHCLLVFPPAEGDGRAQLAPTPRLAAAEKRLTLVLLDGTWRQAARMARKSAYLANLPLVAVPPLATRYSVRKAVREGQMSTAEAALQLLAALGQARAYAPLAQYVDAFNHQAAAARGQHQPRP